MLSRSTACSMLCCVQSRAHSLQRKGGTFCLPCIILMLVQKTFGNNEASPAVAFRGPVCVLAPTGAYHCGARHSRIPYLGAVKRTTVLS